MTTVPSPDPVLLEGELDPALTPERPRFPGWRWVAVWLAFPVAGYIGWTVGGRVDGVGAALLGGAVTGAALGATQGLVLAREGPRGLALPWGLAMPVLFTLGWSVASVTGIGVDD